KLPAPRTVRAHEIGVAELTNRRGAVGLAPRPQIASGKPAEHRRSPSLGAFALQREKNLLDAVAHDVVLAARIPARGSLLVRDRIDGSGLAEALEPQKARIAPPASPALGRGIIAAHRGRVIHAQFQPA